MAYRDDDETVVTVDHKMKTCIVGTTLPYLAKRFTLKLGPASSTWAGEDGKVRSWVWRNVPIDQVRITPRSKENIEKARLNARTRYEKTGKKPPGRV